MALRRQRRARKRAAPKGRRGLFSGERPRRCSDNIRFRRSPFSGRGPASSPPGSRPPARSARWRRAAGEAPEHPAQDEPNIRWSRGLWEAMRPYSSGSVYVNFLGVGDDAEDRTKAAYGPNYERLAKIKAKYDPTNLFRHNQNIKPAGQTARLKFRWLFTGSAALALRPRAAPPRRPSNARLQSA